MGDRLLERHRCPLGPRRIAGRRVELPTRGGDGTVAGVPVSVRAWESTRTAQRVDRCQQSNHDRRVTPRGGHSGQVRHVGNDAEIVVSSREQSQALLAVLERWRHHARHDRGAGEAMAPGDRHALLVETGGEPVAEVGLVDAVLGVFFADPHHLHWAVDLLGDLHRLCDEIDLQGVAEVRSTSSCSSDFFRTPGEDPVSDRRRRYRLREISYRNR